jgi:hypothetical protein
MPIEKVDQFKDKPLDENGRKKAGLPPDSETVLMNQRRLVPAGELPTESLAANLNAAMPDPSVVE